MDSWNAYVAIVNKSMVGFNATITKSNKIAYFGTKTQCWLSFEKTV
jgi:hypothetical protein